MMKAAGWDLDAAANSIEPDIDYAKRAHKKYAFESHICQRMFIGFQQENFSLKHENLTVSKESFFHQYLALREMDPLDAVGQDPDSSFGKFCRSKLAYSFDPPVKIFQVKRESEFSGVYMDSLIKNLVVDETDQKPKVGLMVMPGFWIGGSLIQCRVYLTGTKVAE
ncbi:myosin-4 protein [Actinidia rufa]|uniref:Myosin-4 protein n=1 Tax=Actinidia rufa TaxID=165716 RepID=A0A7J0F6B8_9ERIC|nr:myosin-4 protein [Actinidia rufa]